MLRVCLLGDLTVEHAHRGLLDPMPPRAQLLFGLLMLDRGRVHQRPQLVGTLWPDVAEHVGRRRLSQALWQLRSSLQDDGADPIVQTSGDAVWIEPGAEIEIDVEEVRRAMRHDGPGRAEAMAAAAELYRGPFLSGFYDDWVVRVDHELQTMRRSLLRETVSFLRSAGQVEQALEVAVRLAEVHPLDEEAHAEVIRLAGILGRPGAARRQFLQLTKVLSDELGASPLASTVALYDDVVGMHAPQNERSYASRPIFGRDDEVDALVEHIVGALDGSRRLAIVHGEGGIGKTRVVDEVRRRVQWRGIPTFWASHRAASALRPYSGLLRALRPLLHGLRRQLLEEFVDDVWWREIDRLSAEGPDGAEPDDMPGLDLADERWRIREAFTRVLLVQANIAPSLLVIEDAEWLDRETIEFLPHLVDRAEGLPLGIIITHRTSDLRGRTDAWTTVHELAQYAECSTVELPPLDAESARRLGQWSLGSRHEQRSLERITAASAGNPLFLIETATLVRQAGGSVHGEPGRELPVAPSVAAMIDERLACLDQRTTDLLSLVSSAGKPIEIPGLAVLLGRTEAELDETIDAAVEAGFVHRSNGRLAFDHDLVRHGIYRQMTKSERRRWHRRIANVAIDYRTGDSGRVADHLIRAGAFADAVAPARKAASQAAGVRAYHAAAVHYGQALRCARWSGSPAEVVTDLVLEYEAVLDVLGDRPKQLATLKTLESAPQVFRRSDVARRWALLHAHLGDFEQAVADAHAAVEYATADGEPESPPWTALGHILNWSGNPLEASVALESAVRLASDEYDESRARAALGTAHLMLQEHDEAARELTIASEQAYARGDLRRYIDALGGLAIASIERGRTVEAEETLLAAIESAEELRYLRGMALNALNLASLYALRSQVGRAMPYFDKAREAFGLLDDERGRAMVLANAADVRHQMTGDPSAFDDASEALRYFVDLGDLRHQAMCLDTLAGIDRRRGRRTAARKRLHRALELVDRTGDRWFDVQIRRSFALLEMQAGRHQPALESINEALATAKELEQTAQIPGLLAIEARVLLALGRPEAAVEAARLAAAGLDDAARADAVDRVQELAEITRARDRYNATTIDVELPLLGVSTGRPLLPSEYVVVTWTVSDPSDNAAPTKPDRRRARVLRLLAEAAEAGAEPRIVDLADALGASTATIKRDLAALREQGYAAETRGTI